MSNGKKYRLRPIKVGNLAVSEGRSEGEPSAVIEIEDNNGGFLTARLTTAQRDAIADPASGLLIWNNDTNQLEVYDGSWSSLGGSGGGTVNSVFGRTGNVIAVAGDYDADQIDVTPVGNLTSTDVQAALQELQADIDSLSSISGDAIRDADNDTSVEVERTPDSDTVHIRAAGTDIATLTSTDHTITTVGGDFDMIMSDSAGLLGLPAVSIRGVEGGGNIYNHSVLNLGATFATFSGWVNPATQETLSSQANPGSVRMGHTDTLANGGRNTDFRAFSTQLLQMVVNDNLALSASAISPTQNAVTIDNDQNAAGNTTELRFRELFSNGSNYIGFKAPDSIATDVTYTWPDADGGAGQSLITDGSGGLEWSNTAVIQDADGDTRVQVEVTPDNDTIQLFVGSNSGDHDVTNSVFSASAAGGILTTTPTATAGSGAASGVIGFIAGRPDGAGSAGNIFFLTSPNPVGQSGTILVNSGPAANPGDVSLSAGAAIGTANAGGRISIQGGSGAIGGGDVEIRTGNSQGGGATGAAGDIIFGPGDGVARNGRVVIDRTQTSGDPTPLVFIDGGANFVGFQAAASVSTNTIWTLPNADGSNGQVLTTNGSGILNWTTVAGGTDTSIYNTDGVLNGSRTVSMDNFDVTFESTGGEFYVEVDDSTNAAELRVRPSELGINVNGNSVGVDTDGIKLQISGAGDLQIDGDSGTLNQVITSQGANQAPIWEDPNNIYTSNGSLNGDRNVTMGTNSIDFSGSTGFFDIGFTDGANNGFFTNSATSTEFGVNNSSVSVAFDGVNLAFGPTDDLRITGVPGTSGQVLTSQGANLPPIWATAGGSSVSLSDADGDTLVEVERTPDDDTLRIRTAASEIITATTTDIDMTNVGSPLGTNSFHIRETNNLPVAGVPGAALVRQGTTANVYVGALNQPVLDSAELGVVRANNDTTRVGATRTQMFMRHEVDATGIQTEFVMNTGTPLSYLTIQDARMMQWQVIGSQPITTLGNNTTTAGQTHELRFAPLGSGAATGVGFKAPDVVPTTVTWTLPDADGASQQVLTTDGAGTLSWQNGELGLSAEQTATFTATANRINLVNVSGGVVTVEPPASPVAGDRFAVVDSRGNAATNNITVDFIAVTQPLHGSADNWIMNTDRDYAEFVYVDATVGWIIKGVKN